MRKLLVLGFIAITATIGLSACGGPGVESNVKDVVDSTTSCSELFRLYDSEKGSADSFAAQGDVHGTEQANANLDYMLDRAHGLGCKGA